MGKTVYWKKYSRKNLFLKNIFLGNIFQNMKTSKVKKNAKYHHSSIKVKKNTKIVVYTYQNFDKNQTECLRERNIKLNTHTRLSHGHIHKTHKLKFQLSESCDSCVSGSKI